jgi:hypothetical protein
MYCTVLHCTVLCCVGPVFTRGLCVARLASRAPCVPPPLLRFPSCRFAIPARQRYIVSAEPVAFAQGVRTRPLPTPGTTYLEPSEPPAATQARGAVAALVPCASSDSMSAYADVGTMIPKRPPLKVGARGGAFVCGVVGGAMNGAFHPTEGGGLGWGCCVCGGGMNGGWGDG